MGEPIQIPSGDHHLNAYLASAQPTCPGVLVLHAWWGLNDFIHRLCDRLAAEGLTALAPDLYQGVVAQTIQEAKSLRNQMDRERAKDDIVSAARTLQELPAVGGKSVGMIGFSLGAYLGMGVVEALPQSFGAVVLFYGGRRAKIKKTRASFLVHLAESDPYVSVKDAQAMEENFQAAHLEAAFHVYPGTGHWFFEDDRPEAFAPEAARLAWQRTLGFLKEKL